MLHRKALNRPTFCGLCPNEAKPHLDTRFVALFVRLSACVCVCVCVCMCGTELRFP